MRYGDRPGSSGAGKRAAVALTQAEQLDHIRKLRRAIEERYDDGLAGNTPMPSWDVL